MVYGAKSIPTNAVTDCDTGGFGEFGEMAVFSRRILMPFASFDVQVQWRLYTTWQLGCRRGTR